MTNTHITIGGHKVSAGKKYSTSEVRTGDVWIDGKPIYRKTWDKTVTTYSDMYSGTLRDFTYSESGSSMDTLVNASGTANLTGGNIGNLLVYLGYTAGANASNSGVDTTFGVYRNLQADTLSFKTQSLKTYAPTTAHFVITLEYTKTTD